MINALLNHEKIRVLSENDPTQSAQVYVEYDNEKISPIDGSDVLYCMYK